MNRRDFIGTVAAASAGFTIVPRRVLGGPGYIPPSDMILLAQVGCGMQAQRQVNTGFVRRPELQFVAVVDPNRDSQGYVDWSNYGNRNRVRQFLEDPKWAEGDSLAGAGRGGRDVARYIMETYYKKQNRPATIRAYEDFREMLEKETDIQGIINITPDHQHANINIAALKKGKSAIAHKPVAAILYDLRRTLEASKASAGGTHLLAYSNSPDRHTLAAWINGRRHRQRPRSAQLDQPSVLAAGIPGVLQVGSADPGRLQLDALPGTGTGSPLPSRLHLLSLSRLVRLRRRVPRRHGLLLAVAAVPHPEPRRARMGGGPAEQRRGGERARHQQRRTRLADRPAEGQHGSLAASRDRLASRGRHVLVRRRHEAADAGGALRGQGRSRRRGDADHRRQGEDPLRLQGHQSAPDSESASDRVRGIRRRQRLRHDVARGRVGERAQEQDEDVEGQLRAGGAARRSGHARQHRAARALQASAVGRGEDGVHELTRSEQARASASRRGLDGR